MQVGLHCLKCIYFNLGDICATVDEGLVICEIFLFFFSREEHGKYCPNEMNFRLYIFEVREGIDHIDDECILLIRRDLLWYLYILKNKPSLVIIVLLDYNKEHPNHK